MIQRRGPFQILAGYSYVIAAAGVLYQITLVLLTILLIRPNRSSLLFNSLPGDLGIQLSVVSLVFWFQFFFAISRSSLWPPERTGIRKMAVLIGVLGILETLVRELKYLPGSLPFLESKPCRTVTELVFLLLFVLQLILFSMIPGRIRHPRGGIMSSANYLAIGGLIFVFAAMVVSIVVNMYTLRIETEPMIMGHRIAQGLALIGYLALFSFVVRMDLFPEKS